MNTFKLGKFIGCGRHREVFLHAKDPNVVIKVEIHYNNNTTTFVNEKEWNVWNVIKGTKLEKYFCPCIAISADKTMLLQKYAKPTDKTMLLPKVLKSLYKADITKPANCGIFNERVVVVDYANCDKYNNLIKIQKFLDSQTEV